VPYGSAREKGDYEGAFEYWIKAARLGDAHANYEISVLSQRGQGQGVEKDEKME